MPQPAVNVIYCINPNCLHPWQSWGNKFCNSCGAPLLLKNRYVPLQKMGAGGFAIIYTVWDLRSQIERVLKVLVEPSPKALELFEQEAAVLTNLQHPGVPRVDPDGYFQVQLGDRPKRQLPCLVMEKINGQTLEDILTKYPQGCSEARITNWLTQAIEILRELHSRGIIHRDIKPSNLMLRSETGQLVLIDFGGAKIGSKSRSQESSTRLFSSGYSPPEQIAGRSVIPATDFYALGRTMIHLLTGKYPADLEDPKTGKLRWRNLVQINSDLGNLLDEMVQEDVNQRPQTAVVIGDRLVHSQPGRRDNLFFAAINQLRNLTNWLRVNFIATMKTLSQVATFLWQVVNKILKASWDTFWEMLLSAIGAFVGSLVGFIFTYWLPLGKQLANFISQQLSYLVINTQIPISAEIFLFAAAGVGTAWGLTAAGGFGQRRRFLVASLMGLLSYSLGWLFWRSLIPDAWVEGLMGAIAIAVPLLTLGLGLPSHHFVHAIVASAGCVAVWASFASFNLYPDALTNLFSVSATHSLPELGAGITFFSFLALALGFWLGVSYHIVVPCLRWFGWR